MMFSSSSKLFPPSATVCCHLSSADKTLYWVVIQTGSLKAMCITGRMRAAYDQRGEELQKERLRASISHPEFAKNQLKVISI